MALLVCLIPTTIGGLLSAIGIAGMDRVVQRNVLAMSGRAVEAAGDVDTLLLDKTGHDHARQPAGHGVYFGARSHRSGTRRCGATCFLRRRDAGRPLDRGAGEGAVRTAWPRTTRLERSFIPFTAVTRMSGVDLDGRQIRKGAAEAISKYVSEAGGTSARGAGGCDANLEAGGTPLLVAEDRQVLGAIYLKDIVKGGMRERFDQLRAMGIRTVMITGDNPLTAAAIAREAGVDDFLAQAKPEDKLALIRSEQAKGKLVAMTGDGTNDAPALAQADVGVAMNAGTQAAKEAGNMVDLDSNPTKLIEIVEIGKQLLITRGALTTFSVANDVAKYFAIIPAMFAGVFPVLNVLNIMGLRTPQSAVLSAVIFNAIIIIILVPLALRGVRYRALGAEALLRRNLFLYGFGGIVAPFVGIKLIDVLITWMHLGLRTKMKKQLRTAVWMTLATTVLLGMVYPLVMTGSRKCCFRGRRMDR